MSHTTHMQAETWVSSSSNGPVTHMMNESCRTCEYTHKWVLLHVRVMSLVWMSHVTRMNESCHTYEWVMSHIWINHVTRMNQSCHTDEWDMSHIWISHVPRMNESCHTYESVMSHIWISHVTRMNAGLVHMCDVTRSHTHSHATHTWRYVWMYVWVTSECMCGVCMYVWTSDVRIYEWRHT